MKTIITYRLSILALVILTSCSSYHKISPSKFDTLSIKESIDISEFEIYTFNICERYAKGVEPTQRFVSCPVNFHEVSAEKELRKVEELYLLKRKNSSMVIYMTTFSHKYIRKQSGFLNDTTNYKNKFYFHDTDYIDIGQYDPNEKTITFQKQGEGKDMIWYLAEKIKASNLIAVDAVKMETVENNGDLSEKILLNDVFANDFSFRLHPYELQRRKKRNHHVEKIHLVNAKDGKIEIVFELKSVPQKYKFPASRVRYFTSGD